MSRRVVITGIGVVSPIGIGSKPFWDALCAGTVGVGRITAFNPAGFASQIGAQVPPFKIGDYVPKHYRKATKVMARDIELAVVAADDAFKDAGLRSRAYTDKPEIDGTRFGCNIGAGPDQRRPGRAGQRDGRQQGRRPARFGQVGAGGHGPADAAMAAQVPAEHAGLSRHDHS